ncbi:MAG: hypothetical protein M1820_007598 [Bogoriella megaspora]|nr:MAG: hypothetical protein M1820_007598 [Bogoriella megaspora]
MTHFYIDIYAQSSLPSDSLSNIFSQQTMAPQLITKKDPTPPQLPCRICTCITLPVIGSLIWIASAHPGECPYKLITDSLRAQMVLACMVAHAIIWIVVDRSLLRYIWGIQPKMIDAACTADMSDDMTGAGHQDEVVVMEKPAMETAKETAEKMVEETNKIRKTGKKLGKKLGPVSRKVSVNYGEWTDEP